MSISSNMQVMPNLCKKGVSCALSVICRESFLDVTNVDAIEY